MNNLDRDNKGLRAVVLNLTSLILSKLRTQDALLFPIGSRRNGSPTPRSDYDYLAVVMDEDLEVPSKLQFDKISVKIHGRLNWQELLYEHDVKALEVYFSPDGICRQYFSFCLNHEKLKQAVQQKAFLNWRNAECYFSNNDCYSSRKCIFHALRTLAFGLQIASVGRIYDYDGPSHYWRGLQGFGGCDWESFRDQYAPEISRLNRKFLEEVGKVPVKPLLNVITPVSRPKNLKRIRENLKILDPYFDKRWILALDSQNVREGDVSVPADVVFYSEQSSGGQTQRNDAVKYVLPGWVYYLDDDNLLHPDFPREARSLIDLFPDVRCFVFDQMFRDGTERLKTTSVALGSIDTASFLVHHSLIGSGMWRPYPGEVRGVDAAFIQDIWHKHQSEFLFTGIPCCYWNFLQKKLL